MAGIPLVRYGKSYADIWRLKSDFSDRNDEYLSNMRRIADIYRMQPQRTHCKLCGHPLSIQEGTFSFHSHGIDYGICPTCGHLNGAYLETDEFSKSVYERNDYGKVYRSGESQDAYDYRTETIYLPKAQFLLESLQEFLSDEEIQRLKFLDVGAGSGYFVAAMRHLHMDAVGIEISESQVEWGNRHLSGGRLSHVAAADIAESIRNASKDGVSFIGVLEHIVSLQDVLDAIEQNERIRYLYFSVPMFSYSAIFESIHPNVFNRQLGGTHTHLFTNESLAWLQRRYHWELRGAWYFGTDIADLFRAVMVESRHNSNLMLAEYFKEKSASILDALQNVMDRQKCCSEVHMMVEIRRSI